MIIYISESFSESTAFPPVVLAAAPLCVKVDDIIIRVCEAYALLDLELLEGTLQ